VNKERITVLLTCNTTGTEKLRPLVISTHEKPHTFKRERGFDVNNYVDWHWNKKAWMTGEVDFNISF
jgi:hypothetical protein